MSQRLPSGVWKVVLARLISSTGAEAAFFIGLWGKAAFVFDGTPADLALLSALIGLAAIVGSILGGALVDRFDARKVALGTELVVVPSSLALILADDITSLALIGVVSWTAAAALETAITSLPPVMVEPEVLEQANARLESANWLALVAGPGIGAVLAGVFSIDSVFVLDAATSLAAAVFIARIHLDDRLAADDADDATAHDATADDATADDATDDDAAGSSGLRDVLDGLGYSLRTEPVRLALYLQALVGIAFGVFIALEPLYFRDVLGVEVETIGYVNVVFGLGLFAGSVALERTAGRLTGFRTLILLSMAAGFGAVVYSGTDDLRWVLVGAVAWSIPLGMVLPMARTLAQRGAAPAFIGRVNGAFGVVTSSAGILPVVFAPALAAWIGVQAVLVASGASAVVLAPLIWRAAARQDARPPGDEGGTPDAATTVGPSPRTPVGLPGDAVLGGSLRPPHD